MSRNTKLGSQTNLMQDSSLKNIVRRHPDKRIFCNRNVYLDKITYFGFDMDYTLAEYYSPHLEELIFKFAAEKLVDMGYPETIKSFQYDANFAARGLMFDKIHGNLLKVDPYGNILMALYGQRFLNMDELSRQYPSRFIDPSEVGRFIFFNSLFELPEVSMISHMIQYFEDHPDWTCQDDGFVFGHSELTYSVVGHDVHAAISAVHTEPNLKKTVIKNIDKYIKKNIELPILLNRLRISGKKTFIATNSEFWYTDAVMTHLVNFDQFPPEEKMVKKNWKDYFDYVVVDAKKPLFFAEGTSLCEVDIETGKCKIGAVKGKINDKIFSGGSSQALASLMGAKGKDILYVGDHIFGDIVRSKKKQGWRTYLVVPELQNEITSWMNNFGMYQKIRDLESQIADVFINLDSRCGVKPDITNLQSEIHKCVVKWDLSYGNLGSLLRSGSQMTSFSNQMLRYADLYSHTCLNLLYYPFCYFFRAIPHLLSHELTITPVENTQPRTSTPRKLTPHLRLNTATCLQEDLEVKNDDINDEN